jgi:hypothetical protein
VKEPSDESLAEIGASWNLGTSVTRSWVMSKVLPFQFSGKLRAYAVIEATAVGPVECLNTIRLFVLTQSSKRFQQVYVEKGSSLRGPRIPLDLSVDRLTGGGCLWRLGIGIMTQRTAA